MVAGAVPLLMVTVRDVQGWAQEGNRRKHLPGVHRMKLGLDPAYDDFRFSGPPSLVGKGCASRIGDQGRRTESSWLSEIGIDEVSERDRSGEGAPRVQCV